jgi:hypothetical protein
MQKGVSMLAISRINPLVRAILVVGAVAGLVTGVTFAALNSSATLGASTITSTTASLLLWNGSDFASQAPGFAITDLVPGEGSGAKHFYFKNAGKADLGVTARIVNPPEVSEGLLYTDIKVTFKSDKAGCTVPVVTNFQALIDGDVALPCNPLSGEAQGNNQAGAEETEGNYSVSFDINPAAAVTGDTANVGNFNIVFTGAAVAPAPSAE